MKFAIYALEQVCRMQRDKIMMLTRLMESAASFGLSEEVEYNQNKIARCKEEIAELEKAMHSVRNFPDTLAASGAVTNAWKKLRAGSRADAPANESNLRTKIEELMCLLETME